MDEILIFTGGVYTVLLIIFHLLFWRVFKWPESLKSLDYVNKSIMQVLNISITFIFFIFAYVSFVHTQELLNTPLGHSLLMLISCLWLFRAVQQVVFFKLKNKASADLGTEYLIAAVGGYRVITHPRPEPDV